MREILFRGKRALNDEGKETKNGEFVEGFYVATKVNPHGKRMYTIETDTKIYHVVPGTVGQYTGIKDRKSQKIFEGDIVRDLTGEVLKVVWRGSAFYLKYESPRAPSHDGDLLALGDYWHSHDVLIEVIGNIHDSPERLLQQKR